MSIRKSSKTQPGGVARAMGKEHAAADQDLSNFVGAGRSAGNDQDLADRYGQDIKGKLNPLKAAIEKVIPYRVKVGKTPEGMRSQTVSSNKNRKPGKPPGKPPGVK